MFGQPLEAHYAAAKAGLVGLTNVIAIEGAEHGIRANTVLAVRLLANGHRNGGRPESP